MTISQEIARLGGPHHTVSLLNGRTRGKAPSVHAIRKWRERGQIPWRWRETWAELMAWADKRDARVARRKDSRK